MNITCEVLVVESYEVSPLVGRKVQSLTAALPELCSKMQARFGGTWPDELVIHLVPGPVEVIVSLNGKGELERKVAWGCVLRKGQRAHMLLSLREDIGRTAIHELAHLLLGHREKGVEQAVRDFVNLERWLVESKEGR